MSSNLIAFEKELTSEKVFDPTIIFSKMDKILQDSENFEDPKLSNCIDVFFSYAKTQLATQTSTQPSIYLIVFHFLENCNMKYFQENYTSCMGLLTLLFQNYTEKEIYDQFKEYFENSACQYEGLWFFLRSWFSRDETILNKWYTLLYNNKERNGKPFNPILSEKDIIYVLPFLLKLDDSDRLCTAFEEAVVPFLIDTKYDDTHVFDEISNELDKLSLKNKFLEVMINNLNKNNANEQLERAKMVVKVLAMIWSDEDFNFICILLNTLRDEVKYSLTTSLSFKLKDPRFFEKVKIPNDYMSRFLSQAGIALLPYCINLGDKKQYIDFSSKARDRNKRMKFSTYESAFLENYGMIYTDPVAFETFINNKKPEKIFFPINVIESDEWDKELAKAYINKILEMFPNTTIMSSVLITLCEIQFRLKRQFKFDDQYLWNNYYKRCISFKKSENDNADVFEATFELLKATTLTEEFKKESIDWIDFIAVKLCADDDKVVHKALLATQHAFSHIAPYSYALLPNAVNALKKKGKSLVPEEISILLSIYFILTSKSISKLLDASSDIDCSKYSYISEFLSNLDWIEETKENIAETFVEYSKESTVDHVTLGLLFSLVILHVKSDRVISDNLKLIASNIFNKKELTEISNTNKMIGMFTAHFQEINELFPELYSYIKDYLKVLLMSPALIINQSAAFLEIFADICLYTNDPETLEETFKQIKKEKGDYNIINVVNNRFLMRMNQPLTPGFLPAKREGSVVNGNETIASFNFSGCNEGIEVTTMNQTGTQQYSVQVIEEEIEEIPERDENPSPSSYNRNEGYKKSEFDNNMQKLLNIIESKGKKCKPKELKTQLSLDPDDGLAVSDIKNFIVESKHVTDRRDAIGFLTTIEDLDKNVKYYENNGLKDLSIKSIFLQPTRETLKIGVLFVKDGQRDQNDILSNDWKSTEGSPFQSFLRGIGWIVDLSTHKWYSGKLDMNTFSNGRYHIYYSSERYEVLFHTAVLMPSDDKERQQIYKKRHIGNDNVHIVWSCDSVDYSTSTISSQFNDAHIIIYPICDDLYRVAVMQKDAQMLFGPLHNDTIISECALPALVRWTAIFADRVSRMASTDVLLPCQVIEEQIKTFAEGK